MDVSGKTVLVVEDDSLVLMGLSMVLQSWGMNVLTAGNLAEAESRAAAGPIPDVILTDLNLSVDGTGTGTDVVERVRQLSGKTLPALILTGQGGHHSEAHKVSFLLKPVQPEALRHAVSTAIFSAAP